MKHIRVEKRRQFGTLIEFTEDNWARVIWDKSGKIEKEHIYELICINLEEVAGVKSKPLMIASEDQRTHKITQRWVKWQKDTFDYDSGNTEHVLLNINKLKGEINELQSAIRLGYLKDIEEELTDCYAILNSIAYSYNFSQYMLNEVLCDKLHINAGRKWEKDENGNYQHVKE